MDPERYVLLYSSRSRECVLSGHSPRVSFESSFSRKSSHTFLQDAIQQRALRTLKQKKMFVSFYISSIKRLIIDRYEAQIAQLEQQSWNMESTQLTTDNLRNTMATVDAMKTANKELKRQYGKVDVDKIEQMHYDMEDLLEQANEIQETMARSYAVPDEIDEDELQAGEHHFKLLCPGAPKLGTCVRNHTN